MTKLAGARVLITGGSQGIGAAFAREAVAVGASVALIARGETALRKIADEIGATWRSADVTDAAQLESAITALEDGTPFDVIVCCVGSAMPGRFLDVPFDEIDVQWRRNYLATAATLRRTLPGMVARGSGHVVLVSSTAGLIGVIGYAGYAPAKWALRGLADTIRYEVEPDGVHVTTLYPPDTETPGFAAENTRKPPETAAVSGAVRPVSAATVATALRRGIERDRANVTIDALTRALLWFGGALEPLSRASTRRTIAKATSRGLPPA